jgi:hypothetical protein
MLAISNEYVEAKEDEIARLIVAGEHVDKLRSLAETLRRRGMITSAYYQDVRDTLTFIDGALLVGKQNTAALRNMRTQ